jgi:hypothetical protein
MKEQGILWWADIDLSAGTFGEESEGAVLEEASVRPPNVLP